MTTTKARQSGDKKLYGAAAEAKERKEDGSTGDKSSTSAKKDSKSDKNVKEANGKKVYGAAADAMNSKNKGNKTSLKDEDMSDASDGKVHQKQKSDNKGTPSSKSSKASEKAHSGETAVKKSGGKEIRGAAAKAQEKKQQRKGKDIQDHHDNDDNDDDDDDDDDEEDEEQNDDAEYTAPASDDEEVDEDEYDEPADEEKRDSHSPERGTKRGRSSTSTKNSPSKKQKDDGEDHGQQASASRLPKKGQSVQWKALPGYVKGTVVEIVTSSKSVEGKQFKGSKSDPRIVLKSESSGKICVHKPDAVYF